MYNCKVFCKVVWCKFLFWVYLETFQFIFCIMSVSKFKITMSELIRIHNFKRDWFNEIFLVKFYHSSVYFCCLKCGAGVFGKPNNCCLCSCSRIAVSLVILARESDSLMNYSVIF